MSKVIGYARAGTGELDLAVRETALKTAGAVRVFVDEAGPGLRDDLPGLTECLEFLGSRATRS